MEEMELTQEKRDQLIRRVTEVANEGVLKLPDWLAIYDILLEALAREEVVALEDYLIESLNGD